MQYNGYIPAVDFEMLNMQTSSGGSFLPNGKIPLFISNWVRYKTDIELLYQKYLTMANQSGSIGKTIGPMEINKKISLPRLKDLLSLFKKNFEKENGILTKNNNNVKAFVKGGESSPYPLKSRLF